MKNLLRTFISTLECEMADYISVTLVLYLPSVHGEKQSLTRDVKSLKNTQYAIGQMPTIEIRN